MDSEDLHSTNYTCLPTVKRCNVLAIVNAIIMGLAVLGFLSCSGLLMCLGVSFLAGWSCTGEEYFTLFFRVAGITVLGFIATGTAGVFAKLLLMGIRKKSICFRKAYLMYGTIVELSLIGATVAVSAMNVHDIYRGDTCAIYAAVALSVCVLNVFVLLVAKNTEDLLLSATSRLREIYTV